MSYITSADSTVDKSSANETILQYLTDNNKLPDVNKIITALIGTDKAKVTELQSKQETIQNKNTIWSNLSSTLSNLSTQADYFNSITGDFKASNVSESGYLSVEAKNSAQNKNYTINIQKIALAQKMSSKSFNNMDDALNITGDLNINGTSVTVNSTDSLVNVMDNINNAKDSDGNSIGVNAYVIGGQLIIENNKTGKDAAMSITGAAATALSLQTSQESQNAVIDIDGITVTRSTNSINDAIPGVVLNLIKPTATSINASISDDTSTIKTNITNMINNVNTILSGIKSLTSYDSTNNQASILTGDSTIESIRSQIINTMEDKVETNSGIHYLFDMGISIDKSGTFNVDNTKLDDALKSNPDGVLEFFTKLSIDRTGVTAEKVGNNQYSLSSDRIKTDSQTILDGNGNKLTKVDINPSEGQYAIDYSKGLITVANGTKEPITANYTDYGGKGIGLASKIKNLISDFTSSDGIIPAQITYLNSEYKELGQEIDSENTYIEARQEILKAQFTQMEQAMMTLKNQESYFNTSSNSNSND